VIPGANAFEFKNITRAELVSVLKKVKASKAPGLDKISSKLLKAAGDSIIESLVYLFNLVLNTDIFPDDMKLAKVILSINLEKGPTVVIIDLFL
jgi:hypothetical protein